ncbi:uncharacterized protein LOC108023854 [Drosophila biarmipes]|uniref:uncharacterized protein LOC108023854 n=1 Tax=Drosophila biarmipes TaxID=125945 RepID=UPI0007E5D65E|nr:uncharacterized protein LOC108023854 [Drosophila biarmipes]
MELNGGCVVLGCLLIVLGAVAAQAIPPPAQYRISLDDQADLMVNRYGEPREQLSDVRQPKKDEDEGYDDNRTEQPVLEGFDEGGGGDCDGLPYGPTTPGGQGQVTASLASCLPLCLVLTQLLP